MTPEEIQAMAKGLAEGQALWYVLSALAGGAAAYFGAYKAEKGKNRATKEDIGEITKAVEAAKSEFNEKLEDLKAHHQLRMVAAERRIQAHQDAFLQWQQLADALGQGKYQEAAAIENALRVWYRKNCMFLGGDARDAVNRAVVFSNDFLAAIHHNAPDKMEEVLLFVAGGWGAFVDIGNVLLLQIDLPVMRVGEVPSTPVFSRAPA